MQRRLDGAEQESRPPVALRSSTSFSDHRERPHQRSSVIAAIPGRNLAMARPRNEKNTQAGCSLTKSQGFAAIHEITATDAPNFRLQFLYGESATMLVERALSAGRCRRRGARGGLRRLACRCPGLSRNQVRWAGSRFRRPHSYAVRSPVKPAGSLCKFQERSQRSLSTCE
jgi:hypothetical protein